MNSKNYTLVLAGLMSSACADYSLAASGEDGSLYGDQDHTLSLRIDVYPSEDLAQDQLEEGVTLSAQSFRLEDEELDALPILQLQPPVVFDGVVLGFEAYPTTAEVGVPGMQSVAVEAEIQAYAPGTPMGRTVVSDADSGEFLLHLTPTEWDYQLAVVPRDPLALPFLVEPTFLVAPGDDGVLDFELDYGVPLYGRVTQGEGGAALAGLQVQAIDVETGIGGPTVETAEDGTYELRVYPGSYELRIRGDAAVHLPDRTLLAEVEDTEAGLRLDSTYGATAPITVLGALQDDGGAALDDVLVRFTSVDIYDDPDAELVVAATTASNGAFTLRMLPGTYQVEFIPPYAQSVGPMRWPEIVELTASYNELNGTEPIVLASRPRVQQQVEDADGAPLANVIVRAQELAFDSYAYSTVTDEDGWFTLDVANEDLQWSFTPPLGAKGAATFLVATAEDLEELEPVHLTEGLAVEGCVRYQDLVAAYIPLDVRDSEDRLYASALTGIDGCFSVRVDWDQASPDEALDTGR